ncbi:MAG: creatininase [Cyanobium sp. NAT70]|nr:creatininase [Cyanobium sp. NAT70]|tara:strand:+ start:8352 stop:9155 length:804 start_codon:yes stop_codon:yes gene_type:complete
MHRAERCFERLSAPLAAAAAQQCGSTLIWPFGACEQHGPHLPLVTDALFADRILDGVIEQLPEDLPLWRLPLQAIGVSPEHADFPGTLSLPPTLLLQMVESIGSQLAEMGWRRLVLFNAHGGQIALLQVAARELHHRNPSMAVLPCFLWSGVKGLSSLIPAEELEHGLHAGQAETSLMLHLAPDLVGRERPVDGLDMTQTPPSGWSLEGEAPCAWLTSEISASGVIGDSRAASISLGKGLEELLIEHWTTRLNALVNSDWPPICKRI